MRKLSNLALGASLAAACASVQAQGNVLDAGMRAALIKYLETLK